MYSTNRKSLLHVHFKYKRDFTEYDLSLIHKNHACLNEGDKSGQTPIHYIFKYVVDICSKTVREITNCGGDLSAADKHGDTPLHLLAYWDTLTSMDTIKAVVDGGGPINKKNSLGNTPLHIICEENAFEDIRIIPYLLSIGGWMFITNNIDQTPFGIVCDRLNNLYNRKESKDDMDDLHLVASLKNIILFVLSTPNLRKMTTRAWYLYSIADCFSVDISDIRWVEDSLLRLTNMELLEHYSGMDRAVEDLGDLDTLKRYTKSYNKDFLNLMDFDALDDCDIGYGITGIRALIWHRTGYSPEEIECILDKIRGRDPLRTKHREIGISLKKWVCGLEELMDGYADIVDHVDEIFNMLTSEYGRRRKAWKTLSLLQDIKAIHKESCGDCKIKVTNEKGSVMWKTYMHPFILAARSGLFRETFGKIGNEEVSLEVIVDGGPYVSKMLYEYIVSDDIRDIRYLNSPFWEGLGPGKRKNAIATLLENIGDYKVDKCGNIALLHKYYIYTEGMI